ncbi:hypothetical protein OS175_12720 [Marinicella sp. S1101]|uniref:hypothetical protein n=1 Tax=Marinicella marina TaxID=2996016 RepID=UPI002260DA2D|nr:hypothetical protein [Marinicella marina]MCX7554737.1 hypothetical protein [Marinicella marina]MDJ1141447.1 hypothetical protein [Marinicella marina]
MKLLLAILLLAFFNLAHSALKPADGFWRSTDDPDIGSGFVLLTQGDITLLSVYTYSAEGQPKWYIAAGQVDENGLFSAELRENMNGSYILSENPQSAEFSADFRQLEIYFEGSETARFSIDGSENKSMQPLTFGHAFWPTEHHNLYDGSSYSVPDPVGNWAFGQLTGQESFILSLAADASTSEGVFIQRTYTSTHGSSAGWVLSCPYQFLPNTLPAAQSFCVLDRSVDELPSLKVDFAELGNEAMVLKTDQDDNPFLGKRINYGNTLKPSDGHWRAEDDPEVGSGLVMTTQGDITVVVIYSYDEQGLPSWEIASGSFDASGLFQTTLRSASGGSPIESDSKVTAAFTAVEKSLTIQLLGTELATFSIDGSAPKHIQTINFGRPSLKTENYQVAGTDYEFPSPQGRWLFYTRGNELSSAMNLDLTSEASDFGPGVLQFEGVFNTSGGYLTPYGVRLICQLAFDGSSRDFCGGAYLGGDYMQSLHAKYSNFGHKKITLTSGEEPFPNEENHYYELIRLD